jgi:ubiquinone/menaquinone biosynthesis C-methylase UbiE
MPDHIEHSVSGQYKTSANLTARNDLHARYGTSTVEWHVWVYDHLGLSREESVLELGCGPAWLWQRNMDRLPPALRMLLSDSSQAMVQEAWEHVRDHVPTARYAVCDAQALPLESKSFDLVIANHMLYHVADIRTALGEIERVLKVGGRLVASTIGRDHMKALRDLATEFDPSFGSDNQLAEYFGLETGQDRLEEYFEGVTVHRHEDALVVTEAQPLAAYVVSTGRGHAVQERQDDFLQFLTRRIKEAGPVHIPKDSGLFRATRRRPA